MKLYTNKAKGNYQQTILNVLNEMKDLDELKKCISIIESEYDYSDGQFKALNVFIDSKINNLNKEEICLKYNIVKNYIPEIIDKGYRFLMHILLRTSYKYFEMYKELVSLNKSKNLNLTDEQLYDMFRTIIARIGFTKEELKDYINKSKFGQWSLEGFSIEIRDSICDFYNLEKPKLEFTKEEIKSPLDMLKCMSEEERSYYNSKPTAEDYKEINDLVYKNKY